MKNDIERIFKDIALEYGYNEATVECVDAADLKINWERTTDRIHFLVTDYLEDAPDGVIQSIATTIFRKIQNDDDATYSDEVVQYLSSPGFAEANQSRFLSRAPGLKSEGDWMVHDLSASLERLSDAGLAEDLTGVFVGWGSMGRMRNVGRTSVTMRAIVMNDRLDNDDVPEELLDYCLYSQIAFLNLGFNRDGVYRGERYHDALDEYPDRRGMEMLLEKIGLEV